MSKYFETLADKWHEFSRQAFPGPYQSLEPDVDDLASEVLEVDSVVAGLVSRLLVGEDVQPAEFPDMVRLRDALGRVNLSNRVKIGPLINYAEDLLDLASSAYANLSRGHG